MRIDDIYGDRMTTRIGRNDLCPCGSGKKFKKCHYPRHTPEHMRLPILGMEEVFDTEVPHGDDDERVV